jgi:Glycosyltransferase family 87
MQHVGEHHIKKWHITVMVCLVASSLVLLATPTATSRASSNDFAFYWTAAKIVLEGGNPYSLSDTLALQRRLDFLGKGRLIMLNPPWALPLVAPFGLLSFSTGKSLWLLLSLGLMFISILWLWEIYGAGRDPLIGWIVACTFLPVAVVLAIGQIGPLILFGLAGYLRFEARHEDFVAGAFLFLVALKPHLVWLLWIALWLCALYQRRWKPLLAFLATLAVAGFLAILLDHSAFYQYAGLFGREKTVFQETPTLGGLLRHVSGFPPMQLLPLGVAVAWFTAYWVRWSSSWEWRFHLPIVLLVSMVATPYSYFFDQVVLLPSVFCATAFVLRSRRSLWPRAAIAYLSMNCFVLLLILTRHTTLSYSWTALAWLILFVILQYQGAQWTEPNLPAG